MKFKGDIIITDPCYLMKKDEDWDKCKNGDNMLALGFTNYLVADTEYGDWSCTTFREGIATNRLLGEINKNYSDLFDVSNSINPDEEKLAAIKVQRNMLMQHSLILGNFCADSGLVGVFLLEEVLGYNPSFNYHIERPWTTTCIKAFEGDIVITHKNDEVSVVGKGNIIFYTTQTAL